MSPLIVVLAAAIISIARSDIHSDAHQLLADDLVNRVRESGIYEPEILEPIVSELQKVIRTAFNDGATPDRASISVENLDSDENSHFDRTHVQDLPETTRLRPPESSVLSLSASELDEPSLRWLTPMSEVFDNMVDGGRSVWSELRSAAHSESNFVLYTLGVTSGLLTGAVALMTKRRICQETTPGSSHPSTPMCSIGSVSEFASGTSYSDLC